MKSPKEWTREDLHLHLQHAIELELWTIPLYLSAVYSIKDLDQIENKSDYPEIAKLVLSVVIQEMLHLELVGNLSVALGHTPEFKHPEYKDIEEIPFIHPTPSELPEEIKDYKIGIGPLNNEQLKLFCAIEFPDEPRTAPWAEREEYDSIGELYEALREGIGYLWDECYVESTQRAPQFMGYTKKNNFDVGFSQEIKCLDSAMKAIDAIVAQGEGVSHGEVPRNFQPPKMDPEHFDPGWFSPTLSHYEKFHIAMHAAQLPEIYQIQSANSAQTTEAQQKLAEDFSTLLELLNQSFSSASDQMHDQFYMSMFGVCDSITAVWRTGGVPNFSRP